MNYNITGYAIYLIITFFIIFKVGMVFYTNGRVFILGLFHGDEHFTDRTNKLLLVGYYLLNLGYALVSITTWETVIYPTHLFVLLSGKVGIICLLLGCMHYVNMLVLYILSKSSKYLIH